MRERKRNEKERISREREDERKSRPERLQSQSFVSKGAAGQELVVITPTEAYRVVKGWVLLLE